MDQTNENSNATSGEDNSKPRLSFAEWKKSNGLAPTGAAPKQKKPLATKAKIQTKRQQSPQQQMKGMQPKREPPPLMSLNVNNQCNYGPAPSPNNFNNFNNQFNNTNNNNFNNPSFCRPLQPPPFWEDMYSPLRQPPMQRPLPRWPPESLEPFHKPRSLKPHSRAKPTSKSSNIKNKSGDGDGSKTDKDSKPSDEAIAAAILMPPPPPPPPEKANVKKPQQQQPQQQTQSPNGAKKNQIIIPGQWIPKPTPPPPLDEKEPGTKEERQRMWKEYRIAMKPFKNREFLNAKRCVQRLTKLPATDLDEKQTERLQKSLEFVAAHKAMLTVKHAERWVQKENPENSDLAPGTQIYVRKPISSFWDSNNPFRKNVPVKQFIATGRAIKGGSGVPGYLPMMSKHKTSNHANFGYGLESTSYGSGRIPTHIGYAPSSSEFKADSGASGSNYYSGYGSNFVQGDSLVPNA